VTPLLNLPRRTFLRHLAATPLSAGLVNLLGDSLAQAPGKIDAPAMIREARDALNVFELQAVAEKTMRPAHYGYLQTGVLDDLTMVANRSGFAKWGVRARRMVDVSKIDLSVTLFGETYASPLMLAPVSAQRAFHQDGERPAARAARARNALQIVSTLTTISIETIISDRQAPVWFQLYPTSDLAIARKLVTRADAAGASAIVLTIDLLSGGMRRETQSLLARQDGGNCQSCHNRAAGFSDLINRKAMFDRITPGPEVTLDNPTLTWDFVKRLRDWTKKRVLVKGVMSAEDAELALAYGADGIIVSNHGGRAEESLIGTIDMLPAIAAKVGKRAPILIDGGFRRGTDVFKALALGATAVCIGRPYIWGLSAFGQTGVETALRLMDQELVSTMEQAGVTRIGAIGRDHVMRTA